VKGIGASHGLTAMLEFILRSVGEGIPGTLFCHDLNQRIRFFNDAFASQYLRLTGRVPQLGEPTVDFLPDPELRAEIEKYRRRAAAGEPVTAEYTLRSGESVEIWEVRYQPVRDDQGPGRRHSGVGAGCHGAEAGPGIFAAAGSHPCADAGCRACHRSLAD
jgi:PAS domain-containing protein